MNCARRRSMFGFLVALGLGLALLGVPTAVEAALAIVQTKAMGVGIWVLYRVARGWLALKDKLAMPV